MSEKLEAEVERLQFALAQMRSERDQAEAEVESLQSALAQAQEQSRIGRMIAARVQTERDAARTEVERLRRERDEALVESAQRALSLVAIERDEALAEVERLRAEVERLRNDLTRSADEPLPIDVAQWHARMGHDVRVKRAYGWWPRYGCLTCDRWFNAPELRADQPLAKEPNTPGFDEMIAIRDIADDTLDEVQE